MRLYKCSNIKNVAHLVLESRITASTGISGHILTPPAMATASLTTHRDKKSSDKKNPHAMTRWTNMLDIRHVQWAIYMLDNCNICPHCRFSTAVWSVYRTRGVVLLTDLLSSAFVSLCSDVIKSRGRLLYMENTVCNVQVADNHIPL